MYILDTKETQDKKQVTGFVVENALLSHNSLVWVSFRKGHFSKSLALEMGLLDGTYLGENVQQS